MAGCGKYVEPEMHLPVSLGRAMPVASARWVKVGRGPFDCHLIAFKWPTPYFDPPWRSPLALPCPKRLLEAYQQVLIPLDFRPKLSYSFHHFASCRIHACNHVIIVLNFTHTTFWAESCFMSDTQLTHVWYQQWDGRRWEIRGAWHGFHTGILSDG